MTKEIAMIAQLMKGRNPEEVALQMIKNEKIDNPEISQLIKFAQSGNMNDFNNLAQTIFQNNGLDMNEELNGLISLLK